MKCVPHGISGVEVRMHEHMGRGQGGQRIRLFYAVGELDSCLTMGDTEYHISFSFS